MIKILLADDEKEVVEPLARVLNMLGYEALIALDSASTIEMTKKEKPDIIFLDVCFPAPSLDGIEILKIIREFDKNVKVVLTSGLADDDTRCKEAEKLSISKFLSKPIYVDKVKDAIEEVMK